MNSPDRLQQIEALFHAALELEPVERAAFLDSACADDPALRSEVDYQRYELEAARLMLAGNVVTAAIREASLREQIAATEDLIALQARQLEITERLEKLGTVADLLLDDASHTLIGVVVTHGLMKHEEVLPADAVNSFGADAVVSRSAELIGAKEWSDLHRS